MTEEILRMDGITKVYPNGFVANKDITLSVNAGEIHALLGENGAGKTTLMKVLFGFEKPDGGRIYIKGKEERIGNALEAIKKGVGMVHQHFMLVPSLTVAENMVLGMETRGLFGTLSMKKAAQLVKDVSGKYNMPLDPYAKVGNLSVGNRQKLEILKALVRGAEILILDEPTAVLTPQETEELFVQLKLLKEKGHTIIFISHKLDEVKEICDRFTILRNGQQVGSGEIKDVTSQDLSRLMVGRNIELMIPRDAPQPGKTILRVEDLICKGPGSKNLVDGISFTIRSGEILGIAAVEGNGQNEIAEAIAGLRKYDSGDIQVLSQSIKGVSIRGIRGLGVSYVPEDRMATGCSADSGISENIIADRYHTARYGKGIFLNKKAIEQDVSDCIANYRIKCSSETEPVRMLSGGNIQKVIVAREFTSGARLIVANQPTRGIDVGAAEFIRQQLVTMSRKGCAVLLVSADLTELLGVSDSLIVMKDGQISAYFPDLKGVSDYHVGDYMLGIKHMTPEEIGGVVHT